MAEPYVNTKSGKSHIRFRDPKTGRFVTTASVVALGVAWKPKEEGEGIYPSRGHLFAVSDT